MARRMYVSLRDLIYTSPIYNKGRYPIGYAGVGGFPNIGRPRRFGPPFGRRYSFRVHPDPSRLISSTESPPFEGGGGVYAKPTQLIYFPAIAQLAANHMNWEAA